MTGTIDAHVHLWPTDGRDDITVTRDFPQLLHAATVEELIAMLARNGIAHAIAVQSAPTIEHSDWLVETCETIDEIVAVVGWIDVTACDAVAQIERLAGQPKVRGYRIMLNRMPDPSVIASAACDPAFEATRELALTVECLAPPAFLLQTAETGRTPPKAFRRRRSLRPPARRRPDGRAVAERHRRGRGTPEHDDEARQPRRGVSRVLAGRGYPRARGSRREPVRAAPIDGREQFPGRADRRRPRGRRGRLAGCA